MKRKNVFLIGLFLFSSGVFYAKKNEQVKEKLVNAGILPYWYDSNGQAYFLLGQEPNGMWADFGGNWEKEDRDNKTTAAREFAEETRYVFGKFLDDVKPLEKDVYEEKAKKNIYLDKSIKYIKPRVALELVHPKKYYKMYLAKVDFIPADTFNNAALVPHYEKKEYAWIPVDQFMNAMKKSKNRMEAFYLNKQIRRQIYDTLIENYDTIIQTIYPGRSLKKEKGKKKIAQEIECWPE